MPDHANKPEKGPERGPGKGQQPIPPRLSHELDRLLGPASGRTTPIDLDQRILAESSRVLSPQHRLRVQLKRIAPLAAAAGLAVAGWVGLTIWMAPPGQTSQTGRTTAKGPTGNAPELAHTDASPFDIDRSGRVDIIDAFRVARALDRSLPVESAWDVSGDGLVDSTDVDAIAHAGVSLGESSS